MILGIDPGLRGCLSVLDVNSKPLKFWDMPLDMTNKKVCVQSLNKIIVDSLQNFGVKILVLEKLTAMPFRGSIASFKLGVCVGIIEGIFYGIKGYDLFIGQELNLYQVSPVVWKRYFGLLKKDKDQSRLLAIELFPDFEMFLQRKKDVDRAESLLIAYYYYDNPL